MIWCLFAPNQSKKREKSRNGLKGPDGPIGKQGARVEKGHRVPEVYKEIKVQEVFLLGVQGADKVPAATADSVEERGCRSYI